MEISILLIKQILELFLMILMGYIIVRMNILKDSDSRIISILVLYLIMPCVLINSFQVSFTEEKMHGLLLTIAASILLQLASFTYLAFQICFSLKCSRMDLCLLL